MKPIVLTEEAKQNAINTFMNLLNNYAGDKELRINITPDTLLVNSNIHKPTVFITADAYLKMISLIKHSSDELAWHGSVIKVEQDYLIQDIFMYPQTVTAATVDADEEAYAKWLMDLDDDTINALRFQGHSHVNMGVTPSGRDTGNWQKFLNLLKPGEFYLFCIGNKSESFYWNIYDTEKNVLFENADISMCVIDVCANSIKDWTTESITKYITKSQPVVVDKIISLPKSYTTINGVNYETSTTSKYFPANQISVEDAKKAIPVDMRHDVIYEMETDVYYTDELGVPGFKFNTLYQCYMMDGDEFREQFKKTKDNKNSKKENQKKTKGGNKK